MQRGGYKQKPKEKIEKELLGTLPLFTQDAYDTCVESPFGGCPPVTSFFPSLSERSAWTIEHGEQIIGGAKDIFSNVFQRVYVITPQVTSTHYFVSPTVSLTSTLSLPKSTATITPYSTPTATPTMTLSPTPSATPVQSIWPPTATSATPTPQYRIP
jgi:hypothetical protein